MISMKLNTVSQNLSVPCSLSSDVISLRTERLVLHVLLIVMNSRGENL